MKTYAVKLLQGSTELHHTRVRITEFDADSGIELSEQQMESRALDRAIKKLYGSKTFWNPDGGSRSTGSVFKNSSGSGNKWEADRVSQMLNFSIES